MLPKFADREMELKFLERVYAKKEFSLIVVYGRRRVRITPALSESCREACFKAIEYAKEFNVPQ